MGKVITKVRMWNFFDEEKVARGEVEPIEVEALVDTGATMSVISPQLADRLGLLRPDRTVMVLADGSRLVREVAGGLRIEYLGRRAEVQAIVEPSRKMPLLGQLFLESTCLLVDCKNGRLVPDPAYGGEHVMEVFQSLA